MSLMVSLSLMLALWPAQSGERPAYAREGDRVEQEFVAYRDKLAAFFGSLRGLVDQQSASTTAALPRLQVQDAPAPAAARFGFGVLPRIVDAPPGTPQVSVFSYSWPIVDGYIEGELAKLEQAQTAFNEASNAPADDKTKLISSLILEYRKLLTNQRTIDQYIQYNQFWQRSIAQDRARFDQLTRVYEFLKSDEPDTSQAIREVLGRPDVPPFIAIDRSKQARVVVRVPVYTDIDDEEFLAKAKTAIEDMWQASDGDTAYFLQMNVKRVPPVAQRGDRIDVRTHAAEFPEDGAVLTTGAQTTHSLVGRYVALAPGDLSARTLAHEFGHVLGFRDGYIRGYHDLGEHGFEILELTSVFDDIMSAPREGHVQATHFKLLVEGLKGK
jgi:hypothetical protein